MSYVQQHVAKFAVDFCYRTFAARAGVLYGFVEVSVNALLRGLGAGGGGRAVNKIGNFWRGPRQRRRPRQGCAARASGAARANGAAQGGARPRFSSSPRGRRLPAASFLVQQRMRSTN